MSTSHFLCILILSLFGYGNAYRVSPFYEDSEYRSLPLNNRRAYRDDSPNPFYKDSPYQPLSFYEENGPIQEKVSVSQDEEFEFAEEDAGSELATKCVYAHNKVRERHQNTPKLVWDPNLAKAAQARAEEIEKSGELKSDRIANTENDWGENIYVSWEPRAHTCGDAVLHWYNEIDNYHFDTGECRNLNPVRDPVDKFVQVVSARSRRLGVGIVTVKLRDLIKTLIVAKYSPSGDCNAPHSKKYVGRVGGVPRPREPQDLDRSICYTDAFPSGRCKFFKKIGRCGEFTPKEGCYKTCQICRN